MKKIENIGRFTNGLVSEYDASKYVVKPNAFIDGMNFEINDPLAMLSVNKRLNDDIPLPSTGGRIIGFTKWKCRYPYEKDINILIKQSDNLLLASEDFDIDDIWVTNNIRTERYCSDVITIQGSAIVDESHPLVLNISIAGENLNITFPSVSHPETNLTPEIIAKAICDEFNNTSHNKWSTYSVSNVYAAPLAYTMVVTTLSAEMSTPSITGSAGDLEFEVRRYCNGSNSPYQMTPDYISLPSSTDNFLDLFYVTTSGYIRQYVPDDLIQGKNVAFSIYVRTNGGNNNITIGIKWDGGGVEDDIDIDGTLTRYSINTNIPSDATNCYVQVQFNNSGGVLLYGSMLNYGSTALSYCKNTTARRQLYIYANPYIDDSGNWVNEWIELTESRFHSINYCRDDRTIVNGVICKDYSNWYTWLYGNDNGFNRISSVSSTNKELIMMGAGVGKNVAISRSLCSLISLAGNLPYLTIKDVHIKNIGNSLKISFSKNLEPVDISIANRNIFGFNDKNKIILSPNGFCIENNKNCGIDINSSDFDKYICSIVGVIDGKEYFLAAKGICGNIISDNTNIYYMIGLGLALYRLERIRIYLNPTADDLDNYGNVRFVKEINIPEDEISNMPDLIDTLFSMIFFDIYGCISMMENITLSSIATNNTIQDDFGRGYSTMENNIAKYGISEYINGRMYVAPVSDNNRYIRFSSIRGLVSEIDMFPFSESEGYGYVVLPEDFSTGEITGLVQTPTNDLLIFNDNSTCVYETSLGQSFSKKIKSWYKDIGCISQRIIVSESDYGIFWCDKNNIYWLKPGTWDPERIGSGRVAGLHRKYVDNNANDMFALWSSKDKEYWICYPNDEFILRYSPQFNNWNKIWLIDDIVEGVDSDGVVYLLSTNSNIIHKVSDTGTLLNAPYIKTPFISNENNSEMVITDIEMLFNVSSGKICVGITLDRDKPDPYRNNANLLTFTNHGNYRWKHKVRSGSKCKSFSLLIFGNDYTLFDGAIYNIAVHYLDRGK